MPPFVLRAALLACAAWLLSWSAHGGVNEEVHFQVAGSRISESNWLTVRMRTPCRMRPIR